MCKRKMKVASNSLQMLGGALAFSLLSPAVSADLNISDRPLYIQGDLPPLTQLVVGRDHKLYYEAYNDASDLDGDGDIEVRYEPSIDYYGYFDSNICYTYGSGVFSPAGYTMDKTCSGQWSGDYLNYLTTARIDALRKVLYGGFRSTDTETETILERTYIPQDAHSWGKEYTSEEVDGYDIADYTPLSEPPTGRRHLFANTTLLNDADERPLLRVLSNSQYRIWEWVSIERPVAGDECNDGSGRESCTSSSQGDWDVVPATSFSGLTARYCDIAGTNHPNNEAEFAAMEANYCASGADAQGERAESQINGSGNPFGDDDEYMTVFEGSLYIPTDGTYEFAVDGDDAVEFSIDGTVVASWYGGHGANASQLDNHSGSIFLTEGTYNIKYRHEEQTGGDSYALYWQPPGVSASPSRDDYIVRVEVCNGSVQGDNCKEYPSGEYKPTGLLHDYGENDSMMFGLLTGSYAKNTAGGVLRKQMSSFTDEVDPQTGQFSDVAGIVRTLDGLRVTGFGGNYQYDCGWIATSPMTESSRNCEMWGNPVGEMMYEGLRYFAGKASPTSAFSISGSGNTDADLGLPLATWDDPYDYQPDSGEGFPWCSAPYQMVISDINPSYDTDQVPGAYVEFGSFSGDLDGFDAKSEADAITAHEPGVTGLKFIGQSGTEDDSAPTPKQVESLGTIRGLAPEEPTKQGGYYSASAAYFGLTNDLHPDAQGDQNVTTFSVALASPLPRISIPVGDQLVTLAPFAKSVGGSYGISSVQGDFQPTNQIVDFYVKQIANTNAANADGDVNDGRPYIRFSINYEDVEQGADHDMDAIVEYVLKVNADDTVTVSLDSQYAAGGIIHHLGYVISGTTADGIYLEVRDEDTNAGDDPDYFLDTPNNDSPLPLQAERTFTPGDSAAASFLKDPLWFAAKWGGFQDEDADDLPDNDEWDSDQDGVPDNYFLVTNPLKLKEQLDKAFSSLLAQASSASAVSLDSTTLQQGTAVYQALFNTEDWSGDLVKRPVQADGSLGAPGPGAASRLAGQDPDAGREIITFDPEAGNSGGGVPFRWDSLTNNGAHQAALDAGDGRGEERLDFLRGDRSLEGTLFRERSSLLGDIMRTSPTYIGPPALLYDDYVGDDYPAEFASYAAFRSTYANREPVVYVGANDGMLHAFAAEDATNADEIGEELLAFVPSAVYPNLDNLTEPEYDHTNYVDGALSYADIYDGLSWRTILVGSLGLGGKSVFALDVTNPSAANFDESQADSLVMWEFTDPDLGNVLGEPRITRLENGDWAVIFASGYNSTGEASLFIVDAADGTLIERIPVADESADGGVQFVNNGINEIALHDGNGDFVTDSVYAGDLYGNLWKFDLSGTNTNQWDVAYKSGNTPVPAFVARDPSGDRQPITTAPVVRAHPYEGQQVFFGTGKYLETLDVVDTQVQSFYSIWVKPDNQHETDIGRDDLLQQEILLTVTDQFDDYQARVTSNNPIYWHDQDGLPSDNTTHLGWFIDLDAETGERVHQDPFVRNDRVIFTTVTPSSDPCAAGGASWIYELQSASGARLNYSPFDYDGSGSFGQGDLVQVDFDVNGDGNIDTGDVLPGTGLRKDDSGVYYMDADSVVRDGGNDQKFPVTSNAEVLPVTESGVGGFPRGWRELGR